MADEFVQTFVTLSRDDRLEALNKLTGVLVFDERQAVLDAVYGKNDIIPALPVELLLQVFGHLHFLDAWSLQLVNRRWRSALSSDQFLRAALLRWESHDPSDAGRSPGSVAYDSTRDKILHMQSLRLGKPFSYAELKDTGTGYDGLRPQFSRRKFDFKGKRIVYISSKPDDSDTVITQDLVTGAVHPFGDGLKERIHSVAISSDLVAKVTFNGRLHYSKFAQPLASTMLCLPSAHIRAIGADGLTVAVAVGGHSPGTASYITEILYHNEATHSGLRSINIAELSKGLHAGMAALNAFQILVESHKKLFDIFTLVLNIEAGGSKRSLVILHLRVSFAGDVLSTGSFHHSLSSDDYVRGSDFMMTAPAPTGYRGQFRIQIGQLPVLGGVPVGLKVDAIFDSDEGQLIQRPLGQAIRREVIDSPHPHYEPPLLNRVHAQWKNLALGVTAERLGNEFEEWHEYYSGMNDAFLVSLEVNAVRPEHSRIRVFCFDPKLELYGGKDTGLWEDGKLEPSRALIQEERDE